jgi:hypothetical protein
MTASHWIKLYTEILHDPKVNLMGEHLCWRMVQLFLLAGDKNQDGILPPLADMAWILRVDAEQLETDLIELNVSASWYSIAAGLSVNSQTARHPQTQPPPKECAAIVRVTLRRCYA